MSKTYKNVRLICLAGLITSGYATYVKLQAEKDVNYTALCDLAPKISCTAVFRSHYGRGFGLSQYIFGTDSHLNPSNGVVGLLYYSVILLSTGLMGRKWLCLMQLSLVVLTNLLSLYLAYLLFYVLEEYCLVCFVIYLINKLLLIETLRISKQIWRAQANTQHENANKIE